MKFLFALMMMFSLSAFAGNAVIVNVNPSASVPPKPSTNGTGYFITSNGSVTYFAAPAGVSVPLVGGNPTSSAGFKYCPDGAWICEFYGYLVYSASYTDIKVAIFNTSFVIYGVLLFYIFLFGTRYNLGLISVFGYFKMSRFIQSQKLKQQDKTYFFDTSDWDFKRRYKESEETAIFPSFNIFSEEKVSEDRSDWDFQRRYEDAKQTSIFPDFSSIDLIPSGVTEEDRSEWDYKRRYEDALASDPYTDYRATKYFEDSVHEDTSIFAHFFHKKLKDEAESNPYTDYRAIDYLEDSVHEDTSILDWFLAKKSEEHSESSFMDYFTRWDFFGARVDSSGSESSRLFGSDIFSLGSFGSSKDEGGYDDWRG